MEDRVPFQRGSDTSKAAGESIRDHLSYLEKVVLCAIESSGTGMNCWEVEKFTGISRACSSARLNGLRGKALIFDTGIRRITDTGRNAVVYKKCLVRIYTPDLFEGVS